MKTRQEKEDTTEYNINSTVWLVYPKIVANNLSEALVTKTTWIVVVSTKNKSRCLV